MDEVPVLALAGIAGCLIWLVFELTSRLTDLEHERIDRAAQVKSLVRRPRPSDDDEL